MGSYDGTARLWRVATGECLHTLVGHSDWVRSIAFSLDGQILATASYDGTARVWSTSTGSCLHMLTGHTDWVRVATFSPNGMLVACTPNTCERANGLQELGDHNATGIDEQERERETERAR